MTGEALLNFINNAFFPVLKGKEKGKNQRVFETTKEFNICKNIAKSNLRVKRIELRPNRSA